MFTTSCKKRVNNFKVDMTGTKFGVESANPSRSLFYSVLSFIVLCFSAFGCIFICSCVFYQGVASLLVVSLGFFKRRH